MDKTLEHWEFRAENAKIKKKWLFRSMIKEFNLMAIFPPTFYNKTQDLVAIFVLNIHTVSVSSNWIMYDTVANSLEPDFSMSVYGY